MRNCFNCHRTGHLAKVCRAAQQTIASVARVVVQKSARKKERDQRRWKEFQSRKLEILELPFSGLTQPELLALDLVYEQPFHQRKQRHVSVKDRVCSINAQNDRLQARNLELSSKIETYKEKNKVLERKIQNMKYNEQEIELYQTNINDLKIMLQNKTHEINVLEVQLTDSDYQAVLRSKHLHQLQEEIKSFKQEIKSLNETNKQQKKELDALRTKPAPVTKQQEVRQTGSTIAGKEEDKKCVSGTTPSASIGNTAQRRPHARNSGQNLHWENVVFRDLRRQTPDDLCRGYKTDSQTGYFPDSRKTAYRSNWKPNKPKKRWVTHYPCRSANNPIQKRTHCVNLLRLWDRVFAGQGGIVTTQLDIFNKNFIFKK